MDAIAGGENSEFGPYDRFFLASTLALQARGLPGHHVFLRLELAGSINFQLLRRRIAELPSQYRALRTTVRISRVFGTPRWNSAASASHTTSEFAPALIEYDLRGIAVAEDRIGSLLHAAAQQPIDPFAASQVRFHLFQLADERHHLVLQWPHHLMDLSGVEQLIRTMTDGGGTAVSNFAGKGISDTAPGFYDWMRGMWRLKRLNFIKGNRLKMRNAAAGKSVETLHCSWTREETTAIDRAAIEHCAPGPLLHTRWQLAAVVASADAVFSRSHVHLRDRYLISLPRRVLRQDENPNAPGNRIGIATLEVPRSAVGDPRLIDASLSAQLVEYARDRLDDCDSATTAFVGRFPIRVYAWLLRKFRIFPRYSLAFTNYRIHPLDRPLCGSTVENMIAWGVPAAPPGIIAAFCRYHDRLNFTLTYFSNACSRETAEAIRMEVDRRLRERPKRQ
ncbi:MAG: hypothetical protein KF841_01965 [Phycisphaerae bacterium]|nr:hypothetical protein [Phycisphaerae bacterium]